MSLLSEILYFNFVYTYNKWRRPFLSASAYLWNVFTEYSAAYGRERKVELGYAKTARTKWQCSKFAQRPEKKPYFWHSGWQFHVSASSAERRFLPDDAANTNSDRSFTVLCGFAWLKSRLPYPHHGRRQRFNWCHILNPPTTL